MSGPGRGSTRRGQPAVLPAGSYQPLPPVRSEPDGLVVTFDGEDHRHKRYEVHRLALPGWHQALAAALAERVGPGGGRRTAASADGLWAALVRLMQLLRQLPRPPATPSALRVTHLEAFHRHRRATVGDIYAWRDVRAVGTLLQRPALRALVPAEVIDYVSRRTDKVHPDPKPGYSDSELARLLRAARTDVADLRDRVDASHRLLAQRRDDPAALPSPQRHLADQLASIAATGVVPGCPGPFDQALPARTELARRLFVTPPDLAPLLVLLVGVTGCSIETIKELPVEHRMLEGRAVEVRLTKRRRGQQRWLHTVTWEIGPPGRALHTPGGLYLLLHQLTSPGRGFAGTSTSVWSIWRNGHAAGVHADVGEHHNPFGRGLKATNVCAKQWAARHQLSVDQPPAGPTTQDAHAAAPKPLPVDFNRLKTSIEVRRTRELDGHLPSAARSNGIPVLFRNYLRGDPTVAEWAAEIVSEALADAEQSALAAHRRALRAAGGDLRVISGPAGTEQLEQAGLDADRAGQAVTGELDTAWSACIDHDTHPATGRPCRESFLDCFHCGNCLVTREHLPRLLGLLDAFTVRRQQLPEAEWWIRYGPAWAAIRHDILAKFSPAEIAEAASRKTADCLLDLVEKPWQHP